MREKLKEKTLKFLEGAKRIADDGIVTFCMDEEEVDLLIDALSRLQPCETEGKSVSNDTENRSPFHATVEGMLSPDYKERFKAEYAQTKIRYEKIKAFNTRIRAAEIVESVEMPKHDCPETLLKAQQAAMGEYLRILEIRAVIEGIDL